MDDSPDMYNFYDDCVEKLNAEMTNDADYVARFVPGGAPRNLYYLNVNTGLAPVEAAKTVLNLIAQVRHQ